MPTAGFIVITFIETILVIVPSLVLFLLGMRKGRFSRSISLIAVVMLLLMGWSAVTDPENADFESGAAVFYGIWGLTLYLGLATYGCFWFIRGIFKRWRR